MYNDYSQENHFRAPEDKLLFAKVLDKLASAQKKRQPAHTDFIDPARCSAFMQTLMSKRRDVIIGAFGGWEDAERKMIGFFPQDDEDTADFPISPIAVTYNEKFSKAPTHRDYLGAVLGLGLDRVKIGDICLSGTGAVMYVSNEVADYIAETLNQVGRTAVKAKKTAQSEEETSGLEKAGQEKRITVASLRLDGVLSAAFNLSRGKVAALIENEKVFINWKAAKKTQLVSEGDTLTIRGMGRVTVDAVEGRSKKDRVVLAVINMGEIK